MAALTVTERAVRLVRVDQSIAPGRSAQALDAGTYVSLNAAGEYEPGGENGGVCISTVRTAHAPVSVLKKGVLELGDAIAALDFDATVYAGADGSLDDSDTAADGTTPNQRVGYVMAGLGEGDGSTPKKLLRVDI